MKSRLIIISSAVISLVAFKACQKNEGPLSVLPQNHTPAFASTTCYLDGVSLFCGDVPAFSSVSVYESVMQCLEQHYDAYNDAFETLHSGLTDDQLDSLIDSTGWNDESPLDSFETHYSYVSLRTYTNSREDLWLNNSTLDDNTDPYNDNPYADDPVMATLMSSHGEVMIAGIIYKIYPDGTVLEILDSSCTTLDSLRNGTYSEDRYPSNVVQSTPNNPNLDCETNHFIKSEALYDSNNKKYKIRLSIYSFPWGTTVKASSRSYKKKTNGRWKRFRVSIENDEYGTLYNGDCSQSDNLYEAKGPKRRKKLVVRHFDGGQLDKTEKEMLFSDHYINSQYGSLTLTW